MKFQRQVGHVIEADSDAKGKDDDESENPRGFGGEESVHEARVL
jgi:hypothetical protein